MANKMVEQFERINEIMEAVTLLDIGEMKASDQLRYFLAVSEFAETVAPLVSKYGGSVEELQRKKAQKEAARKNEFLTFVQQILKAGEQSDED